MSGINPPPIDTNPVIPSNPLPSNPLPSVPTTPALPTTADGTTPTPGAVVGSQTQAEDLLTGRPVVPPDTTQGPIMGEANPFEAALSGLIKQFPFLEPLFRALGILPSGNGIVVLDPIEKPGLQPWPPLSPSNYLEPNSKGKIVISGTEGDDTIRFVKEPVMGTMMVGGPKFPMFRYFIELGNGERKEVRESDLSKVVVLGGAGADIIDASQWDVDGLELRGGAGDDQIYGSAGGDYIFGDEGSDNIVANAGDDTIDVAGDEGSLKGAGDGDQVLTGTGNNRVIADNRDLINQERRSDLYPPPGIPINFNEGNNTIIRGQRSGR